MTQQAFDTDLATEIARVQGLLDTALVTYNDLTDRRNQAHTIVMRLRRRLEALTEARDRIA